VAAITFYFTHYPPQDPLDNEDLLDRLILDIYDVWLSIFMLARSQPVTLGANRATSSTTFVTVTDSTVVHTFTRPNARISYTNIIASHGTAGAPFYFQITVGTQTADDNQAIAMRGTTVREMRVSQVFAAIPLGVAKNVNLQFRVDSGTGTINNQADFLVEIDEWD